MLPIRSLGIAIAVLTTASLTAQTRIYVDPVNGSNSNTGTAAAPVQTLGTAVALALSNDQIILLPGTYGAANGETFPITFGSPATQNNLVVRALDGVVFDLSLSTTTAIRLASGATGMRLSNITFINSDQTQWWTRVIDSGTGVNSGNAAMNVEIDRCRFLNVNRGMVLWTSDNCSGWKVHDNLFDNLTNDAILEYTGIGNQFYNNTFHTNLYKAYISDSADSLCYNNLVVNNAIAFECNNASTNAARWQNNWVYQTPVVMQGTANVTLPSTNISGVDPMLVNASAGDYHLQPGSPCIEGGNPAIFARMDLDGVSRSVDSDQNGSILPEIGCYEVSPVAMTATFDPSLGVLITDYTSSATPPVAGFVLFAFDEGLVNVPGVSPILVSPASYLGFLWSPVPTTWYVNLNAALPFMAGTRIVNQVIGIGTGPTILGGNQVWTQF